jgi:hypothetical protein
MLLNHSTAELGYSLSCLVGLLGAQPPALLIFFFIKKSAQKKLEILF